MQHCCTPADENEQAVRYTYAQARRTRTGRRLDVVPRACDKSDRGRFQAPPFVAPRLGKHVEKDLTTTKRPVRLVLTAE